MTNNKIVMLFAFLLSASSFCMEIETDNSLLFCTIPDDCQKTILSHSSLQSLGRLKVVARKYNQWINFEQDSIEERESLSGFLSQDFDRAHVALICAAHGDKNGFFYQILSKQNVVESKESSNYVLFLQKQLSSYLNAYKGLCETGCPHQKLMDAVQTKNNSNLARMILASDLYVNGCNTFGKAEDLLLSAVRNDNKEMVLLLIRKKALLGTYFQSPLAAVAAINNNVSVMQLLLDFGVDINSKYYGGWTALHSVVAAGDTTAVRFLIDKGADINQENEKGDVPLILAYNSGATYGSLMVQQLLDSGADIYHKNSYNGRTALHQAADAEGINFIKLLLVKSEKDDRILINEQDLKGNTPLMLACKNGYQQAALILLNAANSNPNLVNKQGRSALHYAVIAGSNSIVKLLCERAEVLGININCVDTDGNTALMLATKMGRYDAVKELLENKADVHVQNNLGLSAFHLAAESFTSPIITLLWQYQAKIETVDSRGNTVLHRVACIKEKRCGRSASEVIEELISLGVYVNAVNDRGYSAFCCALEEGNVDLVDYFLQKDSSYLNNCQNSKRSTAINFLLDVAQEKKLSNKQAQIMIKLIVMQQNGIRELYQNEAAEQKKSHADDIKREKKESFEKLRSSYDKNEQMKKRAFFLSLGVMLLSGGIFSLKNSYFIKIASVLASFLGLNLMNLFVTP